MAHRNIPLFIPHVGCPHQCTFCNQRSISGSSACSDEEILEQMEQGLRSAPAGENEIAFFGGSFTGIGEGRMIRLLDAAEEQIRAGRACGIRLSTRPDMVSEEILTILSRYTVSQIELGIQSADDVVLSACRRGYTAEIAEAACRRVVSRGFSLVGQMMIGLPRSTPEAERRTARMLCDVGAEGCRIYPTVVLRETALWDEAQRGDYQPLSVEEAVQRSADVLEIFQKNQVRCLRIGLCDSEALQSEANAIAGPHHPALGELVRSELFYRKLRQLAVASRCEGATVELWIPKKEMSQTVGHRRQNLIRLENELGVIVRCLHGAEEGDPLEMRRVNRN